MTGGTSQTTCPSGKLTAAQKALELLLESFNRVQQHPACFIDYVANV